MKQCCCRLGFLECLLWEGAIGVSVHSREGYGFRPSPRWASPLPELLLLRDVGRLSRGSPGHRGWAQASSRACPWPSLPDCITTQPSKVGWLVFLVLKHIPNEYYGKWHEELNHGLISYNLITNRSSKSRGVIRTCHLFFTYGDMISSCISQNMSMS